MARFCMGSGCSPPAESGLSSASGWFWLGRRLARPNVREVRLPHVASATDPFTQQGASQISKDKGMAFRTVLLDVGGDELTEEIAQEVVDTTSPTATSRRAASGCIARSLGEQGSMHKRSGSRRSG
jgi:hypothetical protein